MNDRRHITDRSPTQKSADPAPKLDGAEQQMFDNICGDLQIRIARDGTWFYRGSPIGRKRLVKLFSTILRRDAAGDYWLITPVEKGKIEVEDAPFVVVEVSEHGTGPDQMLTVRTNLDDIVVVGADHPLRVETDPATGAPRPYVMVRDGLEALVSRAVFYHLVERAVARQTADGTVLGVWSGGTFFALGPPLASGALGPSASEQGQ